MHTLPKHYRLLHAIPSLPEVRSPDYIHDEREMNIVALSFLPEIPQMRARYWAGLAEQHRRWLAGGGLSNEFGDAAPMGPPAPAMPAAHDFYAEAKAVVAKAMRRTAGESHASPQAPQATASGTKQN